ncbi:MAG: hypothetical protein L0I93_02285 [Atopostipes suicloacalis]|nr:hypothetical protein [Atopostipes suicloacalis]
MKTKLKKLINGVIVSLLFWMLPLTVLAQANTNAKEEVIYGMLKGNGEVDEAYVVNIFDGSGEIIDYGDYSTVKNMTSEEELVLNDDQITVNSQPDRLYYEGILKSNELPWNISIRYFMDGVEYSEEEIAGKSGALEIALDITENTKLDSFFFENYGLQATIILDTEKAKNILAEDATIANVGKNKQLTYTILPGKGANLLIEADVEDFEMEAIAINGIHLNLGLDFDMDDADLMDKVEELLSGVKQLDQGTESLKSGAGQLKEGSTELGSGAKKLADGTIDLDSGVNTLQKGIEEINQALEILDSQSDSLIKGSAEFKDALEEIQNQLDNLAIEADKIQELTTASSEIQKGIEQLNESLALLDQNVGYEQYKGQAKAKGLDLDELQVGNQQALSSLNPLIEKMKGFAGKLQEIPGMEAMGAELEEIIQELAGMETVLEGNQAALSGTEEYLDEVSRSIQQIYQGSSELNKSYTQVDAAISELVDSLNELVGKLPELTGAIDLLVEKYGEFDQGVNLYTEGVAQVLIGQQEVLAGAASLNAGTHSLRAGSLNLYEHMDDLIRGTTDLYTGAEKLANGTNEFKERTGNIDEEIQEEIDATLLEIMGDASETISFVSEKNTQVESVQFVLKTNDLMMDDEEEEIVEEEPSEVSFWDKLKNLFAFSI